MRTGYIDEYGLPIETEPKNPDDCEHPWESCYEVKRYPAETNRYGQRRQEVWYRCGDCGYKYYEEE